MKRALASVLVAGLGLTALSAVSFAAPNTQAKIIIHLAAPTTKAACTRSVANPSCQNVLNRGNLYPTLYFANLLVMDGDAVGGISGLQCGIQYNAAPGQGVDVFGWTLCATLEFASAGPNGPWPASGSGNLITWDASTKCQRTEPGGPGTGVVANAGYFYCASYTPDQIQVIPRPVDGVAKVADCASNEFVIGGVGFPVGPPSHLGACAFSANGVTTAYNPCGQPTPVEPTTWSNVKGLYR